MSRKATEKHGTDEEPQGKAARTRLRLVHAIRQEIEDVGSISAESVARRADASAATFYNHFASKDEAVGVAFEAAMADLVARVRADLDVGRALELGLAEFLREWTWSSIEFFRANSLVFGAARNHFASSKAFRDILVARESEALEIYTRFIRLGQRAGLVRAGGVEELGEVLMLTSQGWNHPRILRTRRGSPLHEELARSVHAQLTEPAEPWRTHDS